MTKRDYKLVAKVVSELNLDGLENSKKRIVAYALAYAFKQDRAAFDYDKFISACNLSITNLGNQI